MWVASASAPNNAIWVNYDYQAHSYNLERGHIFKSQHGASVKGYELRMKIVKDHSYQEAVKLKTGLIKEPSEEDKSGDGTLYHQIEVSEQEASGIALVKYFTDEVYKTDAGTTLLR